MSEEVNNDEPQLALYTYFQTPIYHVKLPKYLDVVRKVSKDALKEIKKDYKLDEIYPVYQTNDLRDDERLAEFSSHVINAAWDVMNAQGYAMDDFKTVYDSMWIQEHHKHSAMDQHSHGFGLQLVGFYFIDVPTDSSRLIIHDPRPAKVQINMPERDMTMATIASQAINFTPEPGDLYFTPAWLQHSITRNASKNPIRFMHINIGTMWSPQQQTCQMPEAEVI